MRFFVEVTPIGKSDTQSYCVEAESWQKALQAARSLRKDEGPMSGFSIELAEDGARAVDPMSRLRYIVRKAPADAPLTAGTAAGSAPPQPRLTDPSARAGSKTIHFGSSGPAILQEAGRAAAAANGEDTSEAGQAPPPTTKESPAAKGAPSATRAGGPGDARDDVHVLYRREQEPTPGSPLTYREDVLALPPGATEEEAEQLLLARFAVIREGLRQARPGKLVNLAVFDQVFDGRPPAPPLAILSWKDWKGDAVVSFPRRPAARSAAPTKPSAHLAAAAAAANAAVGNAPPRTSSTSAMNAVAPPPASSGAPKAKISAPAMAAVDPVAPQSASGAPPKTSSTSSMNAVPAGASGGPPAKIGSPAMNAAPAADGSPRRPARTRPATLPGTPQAKENARVTASLGGTAPAADGVIAAVPTAAGPSQPPPAIAALGEALQRVESQPPPPGPSAAPSQPPPGIAALTEMLGPRSELGDDGEPSIPVDLIKPAIAPPPGEPAPPTAPSPALARAKAASPAPPAPAKAPIAPPRSGTAQADLTTTMAGPPPGVPLATDLATTISSSAPPAPPATDLAATLAVPAPRVPLEAVPLAFPETAGAPQPPAGSSGSKSVPPDGAPIPLQRPRSRPSYPNADGRRVPGEELIAILFEAMHDLHFLSDAVEGAEFCLGLAMEKLPSRAGFVHFYDVNAREFLVACALGHGADALLMKRHPVSDPLLLGAMRKRAALVLGDATRTDDAFVERFELLGGARSLVVAPVMNGGRVLGAIELMNPLDGQPFTEDEGNAMTYMGEQFADFVSSHGIVLDAQRIRRATSGRR